MGNRIMRSAIQARVGSLVHDLALTAELRERALACLRRESFPLHPRSRCRAGTLSALAYDIAGGTDRDTAIGGAAAVELYMAAGYTLDHVMDDEVPLGTNTGIETALARLMAEAALDEAADKALARDGRTTLIREAKRMLIASCAGQLRELCLTDTAARGAFTTDDALDVTALKAGSLGQMAGGIGARLAGADPELVALIEGCYFHYATYAQIVDDLSDAARVPGEERRSDIASGRPTVPAVYFYRSAALLGAGPQSERRRSRILDAVPELGGPGVDELRESGATLFTQLAAEMVRNTALGIAEQIQQRSGRAKGLLTLLRADHGESLDAKPTTTPAAAAGAPSP
jgi:geranylgeranyl pyrophosphate synthase